MPAPGGRRDSCPDPPGPMRAVTDAPCPMGARGPSASRPRDPWRGTTGLRHRSARSRAPPPDGPIRVRTIEIAAVRKSPCRRPASRVERGRRRRPGVERGLAMRRIRAPPPSAHASARSRRSARRGGHRAEARRASGPHGGGHQLAGTSPAGLCGRITTFAKGRTMSPARRRGTAPRPDRPRAQAIARRRIRPARPGVPPICHGVPRRRQDDPAAEAAAHGVCIMGSAGAPPDGRGHPSVWITLVSNGIAEMRSQHQGDSMARTSPGSQDDTMSSIAGTPLGSDGHSTSAGGACDDRLPWGPSA